MQVRHFKPRDFAQFHPGGELGKRLLTTAEDVMRSDDTVSYTHLMEISPQKTMIPKRMKMIRTSHCDIMPGTGLYFSVTDVFASL